ncbi:class II aldolase/adducin family protein [Myxosarcina sp. GI1]|uniref:class II aldolase/adducin family protein n=1 Tax=Myxosarcina sp. GI1 TaxID=1541065 RepID=UPI0005609EF3|nr:class II aldolase/adducin family protein [Myxosarcina sp. GI1]
MNDRNLDFDEGYIKFDLTWRKQPLSIRVPTELMAWRDRFYELKQIGYYADLGIGYGNISIKTTAGILISGTQTGNIYPIGKEHFTLVTEYDLRQNRVKCLGPIKASSESMTHSAVYDADSEIKAIVHGHNLALWRILKGKVPTTAEDVPYGTPAMAEEIIRLFTKTKVKEEKIIIMAGHEEGIITFGKDLTEAGNVLLNFLQYVAE